MSEERGGLPVLGFADQEAFDAHLAAQPTDSPGLWLRLAKRGATWSSLTKPQAIDTALCHGWIDGQLGRYDAESSLVRMTPRRPRSVWSEKNRTRALALIATGRMQPAGQAQINAAKRDGRWDAAYAPASTAEVPDDLQAALDANPDAAAFFATLTGANRYAVLYRVTTAKRADTRARRIEQFVTMLARGETVY